MPALARLLSDGLYCLAAEHTVGLGSSAGGNPVSSAAREVICVSSAQTMLWYCLSASQGALLLAAGIVHQSVEAEGERTLMDERLGRFADAAAVCERLVRSPIPRSYTRQVHSCADPCTPALSFPCPCSLLSC